MKRQVDDCPHCPGSTVPDRLALASTPGARSVCPRTAPLLGSRQDAFPRTAGQAGAATWPAAVPGCSVRLRAGGLL
jgi:hypothetical protein